jgi:hypothetical protein
LKNFTVPIVIAFLSQQVAREQERSRARLRDHQDWKFGCLVQAR